jgi:hypothetical protein
MILFSVLPYCLWPEKRYRRVLLSLLDHQLLILATPTFYGRLQPLPSAKISFPSMLAHRYAFDVLFSLLDRLYVCGGPWRAQCDHPFHNIIPCLYRETRFRTFSNCNSLDIWAIKPSLPGFLQYCTLIPTTHLASSLAFFPQHFLVVHEASPFYLQEASNSTTLLPSTTTKTASESATSTLAIQQTWRLLPAQTACPSVKRHLLPHTPDTEANQWRVRAVQ